MAERQGGGTGGRRSGSGSQSRSGGRGGQRRDGRSDRRRSGGRGRYGRRRKRCSFCAEKVTHIDYKTPDVLRYFLTEQGKIRPRRQTGVCARHQRRLAMAIKRARHLAMLPFVADVQRRR